MSKKYKELKKQIEMETRWCIDRINMAHPDYEDIPDTIKLVDYLGVYSGILTDEERGMLFAYLSIKSKIDMLEKGV